LERSRSCGSGSFGSVELRGTSCERHLVEPCELLAQSLDLVQVRLVKLLHRIGVKLLDEVLLVLDVDPLEVLDEVLLFPVKLLLVLLVLSVELPVELQVSDDGLGQSNSEFSDFHAPLCMLVELEQVGTWTSS